MAVLVAHGMGQQVQFETLEQVARALRAQDPGPARDQPILVRRSAPGDGPGGPSQRLEDLPRAEVVLAGRTVHLYEMYWAPLTEGKTGLWSTYSFLIRAATMGLWNSRGGLYFRRLLFNRWQTFEYPFSSLFALALSAALLTGLFVVNVSIGAVGLTKILGGSTAAWLAPERLENLTRVFVLFLQALVVLAIGVWVAATAKRFTRPGAPLRSLGVGLAWICVALAMTALSALWLLVPFQFMHWDPLMAKVRMATDPVVALCERWIGGRAWVVIWSAVAVVNIVLRYFVVQYVGDVAAYVSSHTVSAFQTVRMEIQRASRRVASLVYAARIAPGRPLYDRVIVIGHSLGSLIAYDTLNALIREDHLQGCPDQVHERTGHLFTYGSPLDKIAFIFRTQRPHEAPVREALAGSVQPLITSMDLRPARWTNIHSAADWISGDISYFGPAEPAEAFRGLRGWIENVRDPNASTPLLAHNEYWDGLLPQRLYAAVTGND